MRTSRRLRDRILMAVVTAVLAGCGGGGGDPVSPPGPPPPPPPPSPPGAPASLAVQAGDGQTANPGSAVGTAPSVVVRDQHGQGMPGVTVAFSVDSGGGSVAVPSTTTTAGGVASSGGWTLGLGRNRLRATVGGLQPVFFTATGVGQTTVLDASIPVSGGTVIVSKAGDPLNGLTIKVPAGAYPAAIHLKIQYGDSSGAPTQQGLRLVTPIITLESDATGFVSGAPIQIQVPATFSASEWPIAMLLNRQTGALQVIPSVPVGTTSVLAITRQLDGSLLEPPPGTAAFHASTGQTASAGIQLVIGVVSLSELAGDLDSGYRPGVDDWEFDQLYTRLSVQSAEFTSGQALASAWYYTNLKKAKGTLNGRYQKAKGIDFSNPRGYRISTLAGDLIDLSAVADYYSALGVLSHILPNVTADSLMFLYIKSAIFKTGEPQVIYAIDPDAITGPGSGPSISLIAYRTVGNTLEVTLGSSGSGVNAPRSLPLVNQRFAPVSWGVKNAGSGAITPYVSPTLGVLGPTGGIAHTQLKSLWDSFFNNTIGNDVWPAIHVATWETRPVGDTLFIPGDTTRVWLECPSCPFGYAANPGLPVQGKIAGGVVYERGVLSGWGPTNIGLRGNGSPAGADHEDGRHFGVAVVFNDTSDPNSVGGNYSDWIEFTFKAKRLVVSPQPINGSYDTDYDLTATYDRPLPANPSWIWDLGDGRTITTATNRVTIRYPTTAGKTSDNFPIKVTLKGGTATEATGQDAAVIGAPIYAAWKITSMTTTIVNDTRGVDTRTAAQGNIWLNFLANHGPGTGYEFTWNTYRADSTFLYTAQSTNAAIALVARDTLFGPPHTATFGFQSSIYWWTYGSFPTSASTPLSAGIVGSNNSLTRGGTSCLPSLSARFAQTGTPSAGRVTGLNWVTSTVLHAGTPAEPLVTFDYDVTFNGDVASGTTTKTYRIGIDCSGGPEVTWGYRTTITAQRIK